MGLSLDLAPEEGSVAREEPLSRHTTWRIGGPARFFCRVKTEAGLAAASRRGVRRTAQPLAILGMGSNILVADEGFPRLRIAARRRLPEGRDRGRARPGRRRRGRSAACARRRRAPSSPASRRSRGFPRRSAERSGSTRAPTAARSSTCSRAVRLVSRDGRAPRRGRVRDPARIPVVGSRRDARDREPAVLKLRSAPRARRSRRRRGRWRTSAGARCRPSPTRERLQEPRGRLRRAADRGLRPEGRARGRRR